MKNQSIATLSVLALIAFYACRPQEKPLIFREISENGKSYLIQDSVLIKTRDGAQLAAIVVRNKEAGTPEATILFHTIYARHTDIDKAKMAADHGYVGIVSYTRGKAWSPDEVAPYEHEAEDTYDIIDWISRQDWSNGQVGMYGGSYVGFVQWAAAKKLHPALKTIVPSVSVAPGIAEPMENGVYANFHYPWWHYVTNDKYLDTALYNDGRRWNSLYRNWYEQGTSYRSLDSLDGLPNPFFRSRLDHPVYDDYWQKMMPYGQDFAQIDIPVLTTTGYYDGGQIGALYYLKEHYKYRPDAAHYLVIGPYGHYGAQRIPDTTLMGYQIDPVAQINITELIFDWFDHIFKAGPKPELLQNKINYQVMGTNTWSHAPSLNAISNDTLRFYLDSRSSGIQFDPAFSDQPAEHFTFAAQKSKTPTFISQIVNFADRRPEAQHNYFTPFIINDRLTVGNGLSFVTPVFEDDFELNGSFSGELRVAINKKDMDCSMVLYEQQPDGSYFELALPYIGRASLAKDRSRRQLLTPGEVTSMPFSIVRMTSKKISKGSRLVLVLNVNMHPYEQINYGSGKDVNDETIADAGEPLEVKWFSDSYVDIPVRK